MVLLDERGKALSSMGMAELVAEVLQVAIGCLDDQTGKTHLQLSQALCVQAGDRGVASLVFCVGGPWGHSKEVRSRANETIKLSDMVLNHQVDKMLAAE